MNKLLIIAALVFAQNAQAADEIPSLLTAEANTTAQIQTPAKPARALTLQEQIAADAARDPYAETPATPIKYKINRITTTEGYIPPAAAEQMQPSKIFKMKKGNTVIE